VANRTIQVDEKLYQYILNVSVRETEILHRLREETAQLGGVARMQISPEQGQFMALLVELMGAHRMLEVGTFTGYSTLACATALPPDGELIACDVSKEWTDIAQKYWQEAGIHEKITLKIGPATNTLQTLLEEGKANSFDLMFIDADKANYDTYYELGLKLVRPGGLILIDNVLWSGAVANPSEQDEDTQAIRALNQKLHTDNRITLSLIPLADGLTLARRRI
jgi:predicted O-methyltransferase YrrM